MQKTWNPITVTKTDLIAIGLCDASFKFKRLNKLKQQYLDSLECRAPEYVIENRARIGAWCVFNEVNTLPQCKCGKYLNWSNQYNRFSKTCGEHKCFDIKSLNDEQIRKKIAKTRETCLTRYGTTNGGASIAAQEKIKSTMLKRYGVTSALAKGKIRTSFIKRNLEVFGTTNPTSFGSQMHKQAMLEKYGVVNAAYIKGRTRPTLKDLPGRLEQRLEEIKQKSGLVLIGEYAGKVGDSRKWIHIHCGRVTTSNLDDGKIPFCKACFGKRSKMERTIHQALSDANIPFYRNDRKIIAPYELDFVFENGFALETDGVYWHQYGKRALEPSQKIALAATKGIKLLHIWDFQLRENGAEILNLLIYGLRGNKIKPGIYSIPTGLAPLFSGKIKNKDEPAVNQYGDLFYEDLGITKVEI